MYDERGLEGDNPGTSVNWTQKEIMKGFSKNS